MSRIASVIISIYISAFLYANLFFINKLTVTTTDSQMFWNHLGIFLILLIPIYFLANRLISLPYARGVLAPLRIILLSVALVGLMTAILYHLIPLEPVYDLPTQVDKLFSSDLTFTIWLIAPLVVLFI